MRAALDALRVTWTQPLLLIPVLMGYAFTIGISVLSVVALVFYIQATATTNEAFGSLIYALYYVLAVSGGTVPVDVAPPAAFLSPEGLTLTLSGMWTIQFAGAALIILIGALAFAAAYAYTRALTIGVVRGALDKEQVGIIAMFRAGRQYWRASFWYAVPFAMLATVLIAASFPALVSTIYYSIASIPAPVSLYELVILITFVLLFLLAALTVLAEGIIARGGTRPLRESALYFVLHWKSALGAVVMSTFAAIVVIAVDYARAAILLAAPIPWVAIVTLIALLLVVAAWRVWATAFAVALVPR